MLPGHLPCSQTLAEHLCAQLAAGDLKIAFGALNPDSCHSHWDWGLHGPKRLFLKWGEMILCLLEAMPAWHQRLVKNMS